ncbi:GAF domain-containing protein [Rhodanobacter aciditrophus]|uniref:GAF domain-containing protein n=1 Tax=Rhodanobacter aciditrophus TaxID=1623218 RepID=UPI003CE87B7A
MTPGLDAIRDCLDGSLPAVMATCAPDGTPNVAYLSQVEYIDPQHLALSFQFFNKTRQNILANPVARLLLMHPQSSAMYRLTLRYLRTESAGPLFERMRAKLAGIASHTGMGGVFQLKGSDVYRVEAIESVPGLPTPAPLPRRNLLEATRAVALRLADAVDLDAALEALLAGLRQDFDIHHAMVLLLDGSGQKLFTVASCGYGESGVGSEIAMGDGVIGVAARERTPIRIAHMTGEYAYGRAVREAAAAGGLADRLETAIPLPGLPESRSQLAVPIVGAGRLAGVLYVESPRDLRFGYDDEDALVTLAAQLGLAICALRADAASEPSPAEPVSPPPEGAPVVIRHHPATGSVFVGEDYLIKGVAGAILWTLLRDRAEHGRTVFANRELRLDPRIRLPELSDNLEARLILLTRRLAERDACIRIEKAGRGRLRLCVLRPLELVEMPNERGG